MVMALCWFLILFPTLCLICSSENVALGSRISSVHCQARVHNAAIHKSIHLPFISSCTSPCSSISVSSFAVSSAPPAILKMPKTRSRMSCRRGSSRGQVSHQPSSTTSEPSSDASEFSLDRYPATRSDRGRGRGQFISEACSHHSQSHTAHFRFPCSLSNSSFIASVTIELSEDAMGSGAVGSEVVGPLEPTSADRNASTQTKATQQKDPGGLANQETTTHAGPSAPAEGGSSGNKGQSFESEDSKQFGCHIIEESPPTSLND